jgi:SAM-dependent methyltransferase
MIPMPDIEPSGTYRPQFRLRRRGLVRALDLFPRLKTRLADLLRPALERVFDPGLVTTERVIEYPFVFQNLDGVKGLVLDIGCCGSRLPIALASRGFRVIGVDISPYPYRHPNLRVVCGDAVRLPFATGTLAAVLAISVIEHVGLGHYGDPSAGAGDLAAAREISRVLTPGGRALITVPFGTALTDDWKRVYDPPRLARLLAPFSVLGVEYAVGREGLWTPSSEGEACSIDWTGPDRAVALVVATRPLGAAGAT